MHTRTNTRIINLLEPLFKKDVSHILFARVTLRMAKNTGVCAWQNFSDASRFTHSQHHQSSVLMTAPQYYLIVRLF